MFFSTSPAPIFSGKGAFDLLPPEDKCEIVEVPTCHPELVRVRAVMLAHGLTCTCQCRHLIISHEV